MKWGNRFRGLYHTTLAILYFFFLMYLFILGCVRSSLLHAGFLYLRRAGATLRCSVQASHCSGFSCCGARALGVQASVAVARRLSSCGSQALKHRLSTGLVALRHVWSSQTRAWTRVPCIGRWILNHCTTREVPTLTILEYFYMFENHCEENRERQTNGGRERGKEKWKRKGNKEGKNQEKKCKDVMVQEFLGQWNYSAWFCNEDTCSYTCHNPQTVQSKE